MQIRCLIIDDNSPFLDAASELLDREGIDVVATASTSAEAMRLVKEHRPDVTLVDIDLGEEDGFELARTLTNGRRAAKVILVSTHSEDELVDLIAASPALGFIRKTRLSAQAIHELLDGS